MTLSAPTVAVWLLSTLLAALVIVLKYTSISIPEIGQYTNGRLFEILLAAYVLLWAGTVLRRV